MSHVVERCEAPGDRQQRFCLMKWHAFVTSNGDTEKIGMPDNVSSPAGQQRVSATSVSWLKMVKNASVLKDD